MTAPASPVTVCDDPGFRAAIRELVRAQGWGTARDVVDRQPPAPERTEIMLDQSLEAL
jgi:hypothetical protein